MSEQSRYAGRRRCFFRLRQNFGATCGVEEVAKTGSPRTEKSCGPDASTLASSLAEVRFGSTGPDKTFQSARRRWQKSPIAGESTKEAVKTTRVRECRVISGASAVNTRVHTCYPPAHTRLRVHWAPGIPHALCFRGRNISGIARAQRAARTLVFVDVIPGRECNERNLEIPLAGR